MDKGEQNRKIHNLHIKILIWVEIIRPYLIVFSVCYNSTGERKNPSKLLNLFSSKTLHFMFQTEKWKILCHFIAIFSFYILFSSCSGNMHHLIFPSLHSSSGMQDGKYLFLPKQLISSIYAVYLIKMYAQILV